MSKSLVIVESPAKAKTIEKYLGKGFEVRASVGHIMDLPKNDIGVELKKRTFEPELIVSPGKEKVVDQLKKAGAKADEIFLAPDPDREGEAIAYHLFLQLGTSSKEKKKIRRVTFNEITKKAVQDAFSHARDLDQHLVDAQQTRRVLDRLVGYQISPLLWDKVRRGLSAGRVQTVALRLVVEREREISAFKPVEYWTLEAQLHPERRAEQSFKARLIGINGEKISVDTVGAPALPNEKEVKAALAALEKARWTIDSISKRERKQSAPAPFTTSQLQQDAARKLGFNVRRTMGVAQRLYEGIEIGAEGTTGLITYMRTDSPRVSPEAVTGARSWIEKELGSRYLPDSPNVFKGKKDAQDAHEAIRPTDAARTPESIARFLSDEQLKLYTLIWKRFVASQMAPAQLAVTQVNISAASPVDKKTYDFRVSGTTVLFDGYQKLYEASKEKKDEDDESLANKLPNLDGVKALELEQLIHEQHFTEPPPRYNEASLVKELEERGIGRPSTYASIINTIQDREYVVKHGGSRGRFYPTEIGMVVCDLLVKNFPYIFDTAYTAKLEEELDDIEDGKEKWTTLLNGFYDHFEDELKVAGKKMENIKRMEKKTNEKCEVCGSPLILKWGKFGSFYACSAYNKKDPTSCTFTKENTAAKPDMNTPEAQEAEESEEYCENCGRVMVLRRGPFGMFMACPGYSEDPPCKTIRKLSQKQQQKPPQPTGEDCPVCGKPLVLRNGAYGEFVSCSGYPKCKYIKQNLIEGMKCPKCGEGDIAERKARRGNVFWGCTNYPKCDFTSNYKPVPKKCPQCGSPYLVEKTLKSGIYLECPNKKKGAEEEVKPKRGKKTQEPAESAVVCTYSKRIGNAPPPPTAETHGPVTEKPDAKRELLPA
ncbi:MAG TPA: type I DNA topoisomerase [Terracidiphilus sp.]|nr:type I DNA topoisomerase [Terracidiphilus sp.]